MNEQKQFFKKLSKSDHYAEIYGQKTEIIVAFSKTWRIIFRTRRILEDNNFSYFDRALNKNENIYSLYRFSFIVDKLNHMQLS